MLLLNEIAKDQMVSGLGYASLSTSLGARRQRSGMDPRVKPEDDEGVGGFAQLQTLTIGGDGQTALRHSRASGEAARPGNPCLNGDEANRRQERPASAPRLASRACGANASPSGMGPGYERFAFVPG